MSNSPITIFLYKKSRNLKAIIDEINKADQREIAVIIDFPENNCIREKQKLIVEIIASNLHKEVKVSIHRPSSHQGIRNIFSYGLGKVFEIHDKAIILEDDTIPNQSFFSFCDEMLDRFETDESIGCISGCNLGVKSKKGSFFTSRINLPFWGWATWKDSWIEQQESYAFWHKYRANYPTIIEDKNLGYFIPIFDRFVQKDKSWDVKWSMHLLANHKKSVLPVCNLISNAGFVKDATFTHIENSDFASLESYHLKQEKITNPSEVELEKEYLAKIKLLFQDMSRRKSKQ